MIRQNQTDVQAYTKFLTLHVTRISVKSLTLYINNEL